MLPVPGQVAEAIVMTTRRQRRVLVCASSAFICMAERCSVYYILRRPKKASINTLVFMACYIWQHNDQRLTVTSTICRRQDAATAFMMTE